MNHTSYAQSCFFGWPLFIVPPNDPQLLDANENYRTVIIQTESYRGGFDSDNLTADALLEFCRTAMLFCSNHEPKSIHVNWHAYDRLIMSEPNYVGDEYKRLNSEDPKFIGPRCGISSCIACGKSDRANYLQPTRAQMIEMQLCFECLHWVNELNASGNVVIDGYLYSIGDEHQKGMRGFGGRRFDIRLFDGTEVTTTNLWSAGRIPERFRDHLSDNATFM